MTGLGTKLYLARFIFSQNLGKIRADDARFLAHIRMAFVSS